MPKTVFIIALLLGVAVLASASTYLWESTRVVELYCADPLEYRDGQCLCPEGEVKLVGSDGVAHCWKLPSSGPEFDICKDIPDLPECNRPDKVPPGPDPENPLGK